MILQSKQTAVSVYDRLLVISTIILCSCTYIDEDNISHLRGGYYTANYDNGVALHFYSDVTKPCGEPLLDKVYATYINGDQVVARAGADYYFVYSPRAASLQDAKRLQKGPLSKAELNAMLLQLTGDTTLIEVGPF